MKCRRWLIAAALFVLALAPYIQTHRFDFLCFDDKGHVSENRDINGGLRWESFKWSWSAVVLGNWIPLTLWTHMLDSDLYRGNDGSQWAGGHHLSNTVLHGVNTSLLFWLLFAMTAATWRSALIAAIFAVHPQHVESVAWISERKDVLSTLFGLLAILAYVRHARRPSAYRYMLVVAMFALSLMAKPMWVTLPFVLLLLDIWPLRRMTLWGIGSNENIDTASTVFPKVSPARAVMEKVPLLALSAASSVTTLLIQKGAGAVSSMGEFSLEARIANAIVAYASYLAKFVWPSDLAVYYPHPGRWDMAVVIGSATVLLVVTVVSIAFARKRPWMLIGWLLYGGMLVPVIGLVQVGGQYMADRYMYVPSVWLSIMLVWSLPKVGTAARVSMAVSVMAIAILTAACFHQVGYWRDNITLFTQALRVTNSNAMAHVQLAEALEKQGRIDEAEVHCIKAIDIAPSFVVPHDQLAHILMARGREQEAFEHLLFVMRQQPTTFAAHHTGRILLSRGDLAGAEKAFEIAIDLDPANKTKSLENLGSVLLRQGRMEEARTRFAEALSIDPDSFAALTGVGITMMTTNQFQQAAEFLERALKQDPSNWETRANYGRALLELGRFEEAIVELSQVKRPERLFIRTNLARALAAMGLVQEAMQELEDVLKQSPSFAPARDQLNKLSAGEESK